MIDHRGCVEIIFRRTLFVIESGYEDNKIKRERQNFLFVSPSLNNAVCLLLSLLELGRVAADAQHIDAYGQ